MSRWSRHKKEPSREREWRPVHLCPSSAAADPDPDVAHRTSSEASTNKNGEKNPRAAAIAEEACSRRPVAAATGYEDGGVGGEGGLQEQQQPPASSSLPSPAGAAVAAPPVQAPKMPGGVDISRQQHPRWATSSRPGAKSAQTGEFPGILSTSCQPQAINLGGADILLFPGFLTTSSAGKLYEELAALPSWQKRPIWIRDRETGQQFEALEGRPTISFSEPPGRVYSYSGSNRVAEAFTDVVLKAKLLIEQALKDVLEEWGAHAGRPPRFNYCLANLYENGWQSVGKHADDEPDILKRSPIATLSLGASRHFLVEAKGNPDLSVKIPLHSGDLLLMQGRTQERFVHSIPKEKRVKEPRISLTFRMNR